jgi:hypothetical protein
VCVGRRRWLGHLFVKLALAGASTALGGLAGLQLLAVQLREGLAQILKRSARVVVTVDRVRCVRSCVCGRAWWVSYVVRLEVLFSKQASGRGMKEGSTHLEWAK